MQKNKKNGLSLISIIILIFIGILVLSYLGISIRGVVESPEGQDNIGYVAEGTKTVWDKYLKDPAKYVWNEIFIDLLWSAFINNLERVRDGEPTEIEESAPALPMGLHFQYSFV